MSRYEKRRYSAADLELIVSQTLEKLNREPEDFTASWLLEGGIGSAIWKTTNGNKHRKTENGWKHTMNVHFHFRLPDDTYLTDPENSVMLHAIQKYLFYLRSGLYPSHPGPRVWADHVPPVLNLAAWMYIEKERYLPEKFGFKLLNEETIRNLIAKIAIGGWEHALSVIPRLLDKLHIKAFGVVAPENLHSNPFNLSKDVKSGILKALASEKSFVKHQKKLKGKSQDRIPNSYILELLGKPGVHEKNSKMVLFLSQFNKDEPSGSLINDYVRVSQYPKRTAAIVGPELNQPLCEGTIKNVIYKLNIFFRGNIHKETTIPKIKYNPKELRLLAAQYVAPSQHKQLIPLKFGLKILRRSTELVIIHGNALIESCLDYIRILHNKNSALDFKSRQELAAKQLPEIISRHMTIECEGLPSKSIGRALKIDTATRELKSLDPENLSLNQALGILIGAQCNIISMLKPLRNEELINLRRDCVSVDTLLGGAWIESTVGKTGAEGINMEATRPIPNLTLKAIAQLSYFGRNLAEIYQDKSPHATEDLFYIPSPIVFTKSHKISVQQKIGQYIGLFHDYIEAPIDEYGRRFYPGPHEFRKFFILLMYWHEQNIGFSCAAWMAGHQLTEHTQAYTDASVSAAEISLWEAECIEDKIIELEESKEDRHDIDGLVALYEAVKQRFGVGRVEGLQRRDYIEFLQDLLDENTVTIKPFLIYVPGQQEPEGIDLAFKFEDKQDEQF